MKSLAELGSEADAIRRDLAMLHAKHAVAAETLRKLDEDIATKQSEAQAIQERVADAFDAIQGMGAQKAETPASEPQNVFASPYMADHANGAEAPQF